MNWGNRIVVAFVCFAAFIGYMVVRAFQEDFDLVAEDYYAKEIAYQDKLDKLSNASKDEKTVSIVQTAQAITLTFTDKAKGEIQFYHPSRKLFDRSFDIALNNGLQQSIDKEDLVPGNYRINISWKVDGKEYLQQSSIYIQ